MSAQSNAKITPLNRVWQADDLLDKDNSARRVYDSIIDLAPSPENPTPMVRLSERMNPHADYEVLLKLEGMNAFGSIKDRTALYMLRGLQLKAGQILVEPSAGNTGVVKSMVESEAYGGKYVSPNQYESKLNVEAHYRTTGPEIWNQTKGDIDYFFAGIGTGGTISGVGRFLKEKNPNIKIIGVEPATRQHTLSGLKRITGLPDEHFPKILDRDLLDDLISVTDEEASRAGIEVARKEGIMVGPTTGAVLFAALNSDLPKNGKAVLISADNAARYVSAYSKYL